MKLRISPFSAILIFVVLSFIGAASIPLLNIQYTPSIIGNTITVAFSYSGAPAQVVESTVTSKLEGIISHTSGCTSTSSISKAGYGSVSGTFSKHTDLAAARLEIVSGIRNIYSRLPENVSFPNISHNAGGGRNASSISYNIMGEIPTQILEKYTNENIIPEISVIDGVNSISLKGVTDNEWLITFDSKVITAVGITPNEISAAIINTFTERLIGISKEDNNIAIRLTSGHKDSFDNIPIKKVGEKIIYLRDIAQWRYQESEPTSYFRVNGLNTITLSIGMSGNKNILQISKDVRSTISKLEERLPKEISMRLASDSSQHISDELNNIFFKIAVSIAFILLFTLLAYRSWRYTLIILLATIGNTLICFAIYVVCNITIHIYALVGVTIAMGIAIGFYTIAIDHYNNRKKSKVLAWLGASAATIIGALIMILILPEEQKKDLKDFVLVVCINLSIALILSYLFIPSLLKYIPIKKRERIQTYKAKRKRVRNYSWYKHYLNWGMKHKWVYILLGILFFGIPTCLLPTYEDIRDKSDKTKFDNIIEKIVSWEPYRLNRATIDKIFSGSFGVFYQIFDPSNFHSSFKSKTLNITATMPEGCTVSQLNEIIKGMEDFLSGMEQISTFTTEISPSPQATISIKFLPEYENSPILHSLKSQIILQASKYGGASWIITGLDFNNFNNNISVSELKYRIQLTGYNFDELDKYARLLKDEISKNKRVQTPEIRSIHFTKSAVSELNMSYDFEDIVLNGITPYSHFSTISAELYNKNVTSIYTDGNYSNVILKSSLRDEHDYWNLLNTPVEVSGNSITLKHIGNLERLPSAIDIVKTDQSYVLNVCFNVLGSLTLAKRIINNNLSYFNNEVLPLGFKASSPDLVINRKTTENFVWILFLIVIVIFVLLSISLESFRNSFLIIFTILLSFIAPFLLFGTMGFDFDQGGFIGFIILSGIIASGGIYMIYGYEENRYDYAKALQARYISLFVAIIAISISAIPFLLGGVDDIFWFDFAAVIIPGLMLYLVLTVLVFPIFLKEPSSIKHK